MSLPTAFNATNEQGGVLQEHDFGTKAENMHVLYYVARNMLYSDEPLALLREYGCNGMDIHTATGQNDRPILVTLPTILDSFLRIRDFGTGLDEQGMKDYVSFGESSKRNDPLQTGQLGLGCKCGFTYGDSFIVNSYQNGVLTSWNAYIDPSNKGKLAKMSESETTEENGIEVVLPVNHQDINKFHEKAMWLYSFARITPNFVNATDDDLLQLNSYKNKTPVFSGPGWKYFGSGPSYAVMGNIPYPIKDDVFTDLEMREEVKALLQGSIIIDFPMDALNFAASREQLKYTPSTKAALADKLNEITEELFKMCNASFAGCKTLWEAKILYKNVFDFAGKLYPMRGLFKSGLSFNGFKVNVDGFPLYCNAVLETEVHCNVYAHSSTKAVICKERAATIHASERNLVVINDSQISNGVTNRIARYLMSSSSGKQYEKVYVISFSSLDKLNDWAKSVGFDYAPVLLSALSKESLSQYFPHASSGLTNPKHKVSEFEFVGTTGSRYRSNNVEAWNVIDVDIENGEGVYTTIERFLVVDKQGNYVSSRHLVKHLNLLKSIGIVIPTIYGFKRKSALAAKGNVKMVDFWVWAEKSVNDFISANPIVAQQYANYLELKTIHSLERQKMQILCDCPAVLAHNGNHAISLLMAKMKELAVFKDSQMEALTELGYKSVAPATYVLQDENANLRKKYPLLFVIYDASYDYHLSSGTELHSHLSHYIDLIDASTN